MVVLSYGNKYNNSNPFLWLCSQMPDADSVLEVYGAHALMWAKVWSKFNNYEKTEGDAIKWLKAKEKLSQDIFDVDPYGSPYEAIFEIAAKAVKPQIGIAATDGALRYAGKIRGSIPKILLDSCGWDGKSRTMKAAIFYQYPAFLRHALLRIMPGWRIDKIAVKYAVGQGKAGIAYWAGLFCKA